MVRIDPISENNVNGSLEKVFNEIKTSLELPHVPVFFRYLANFENYFYFIWEKINRNISDPQFKNLVLEISDAFYSQIEPIYNPDEAVLEKVNKIAVLSADRYLIENDNKKVFMVNSQLLLIFLSLREAVKGWAVGARKISSENKGNSFVSEREAMLDLASGSLPQFIENHDELAARQGLTVSAYSKFLTVVIEETYYLRAQKEYVYRRVELEKYLLDEIHRIPHAIQSSFATVAGFAGKDPHFNELLYLLSESFPTLSVLRMTSSVVGKIILSRASSGQ